MNKGRPRTTAHAIADHYATLHRLLESAEEYARVVAWLTPHARLAALRPIAPVAARFHLPSHRPELLCVAS